MTHPLIESLQVNEAQFVVYVAASTNSPRLALKNIKPAMKSPGCLAEWGYEVHRSLAGTGVVGTLESRQRRKRLGLRADMDALPMQEMSGKAWASQVDGRFHGWGHDGHHHAAVCGGISGAHASV